MASTRAGVRRDPEPDRAVAVVVRDGRLLVISRYLEQQDAVDCVMCRHQLDLHAGRCPGHAYDVLPGGGVEDGESPRQAAERELAEESTMTATSGRLLWVGTHNGRRAHYFEMVDVSGDPVLSGPEAEAQSPRNSFTFRWLTPAQAQGRPVHPPEVVRHLVVDGRWVTPDRSTAPSAGTE